MSDWRTLEIPEPDGLGIHVIADQPLVELLPYIDWSPFFHTWELKGRYPGIFEHPTIGAKAKELFADAQQLLARIVDEKLLTRQRGLRAVRRLAASVTTSKCMRMPRRRPS